MNKSNWTRSMSLGAFIYFLPCAQAADIAMEIGIGTRDISAAEASIQSYLNKRRYTEQITDLDESINLEGMIVPYLILSGTYIPKKPLLPKETIEHKLEFNTTANILGPEKDSDKMNVSYKGLDLGEVDVDWSYEISSYFSLKAGSIYSPIIINNGNSKIKLGFSLTSGISYMKGLANLVISLENNELYRLLDNPSFIEEEYGITEKNNFKANFSGLGYIFHPTLSASLEIEMISLQIDWGYRAESIKLHIIETIDSLEVTTERTNDILEFSGKTFSASIKYRF